MREKIMELIMRLTNEYKLARGVNEWEEGYYCRLSQEIRDLKKLLEEEEW